MNIEIHIEELVLRGLDVKNRNNVAQTIQRELIQLLTDRGLPAGLQHSVGIRQMRAPGFQVSQAGGDESLATQVAQSTYGAMER
jgi:hypothetical protein